MFKKIFDKLRTSKERRDAYVSAQIDVLIPFQIRALRKQYGLEQEDLAGLANMAQPSISKLEKAGNRANIETLKRIANALDVALIVKFVPFSELVRWSDNFSPDGFTVPNFSLEMEKLDSHVDTNIYSINFVSKTDTGPIKATGSTARRADAPDSVPQLNLPIPIEPQTYLKTAQTRTR